jgi:alpha-tubulin suppressor-like RCC1 family protein
MDDNQAALLHLLKLDELTAVCLQLDLPDLVHIAATCKHLWQGDGGLSTVVLPIKSVIMTALRELAFPRPEPIPSTRPVGYPGSWVTYLARCARQRRCRETPPIAAGREHSLFVDTAGRLLACGRLAGAGHGALATHYDPTPMAAMAGIQVRSVAAGTQYSLALGWDGRVYSWGDNLFGQLGLGDTRDRLSPTLVEGLEGARSVAAAGRRSLAATQSGSVFRWGRALPLREGFEDRPTIVEGVGGVRRVCAGDAVAFAIGEEGQLFSWGLGDHGRLGHRGRQSRLSPKRVRALRVVRVSTVSIGYHHVLALSEDGLVYAWGDNKERAVLGNPHVVRELLPRPIEALRGVRVGSIAAADCRSYAVTDSGEVWAWGWVHSPSPLGHGEVWAWGRDENSRFEAPLGHGEQVHCPLPRPIESLRGVKVDAVAAGEHHTLALADNGSVYAWGNENAAHAGALGLGLSMRNAVGSVLTPQRVPALQVECGL